MKVFKKEDVLKCINDTADCDIKIYAIGLLEWAINKRTFDVDDSGQRTGEWITTRTIMHDGEFYCDQCNNDAPLNKEWDYCPYCGAYMKGENKSNKASKHDVVSREDVLQELTYIGDDIDPDELTCIFRDRVRKLPSVVELHLDNSTRHCWECGNRQTYRCVICKNNSQFELKCESCAHKKTSICGNCNGFDEYERLETLCDTCDRNVCATRNVARVVDKCVNYEPKKASEECLKVQSKKQKLPMSCDDCCYEPNSPFCNMYRKDICEKEEK